MFRRIKDRTNFKRSCNLELCRLPAQLDLADATRVLVFSPHPDDESLGCGGTLARLAAQCPVKVVLVTDGSGAGGLPPGAALIRRQEFIAALAELKIDDFLFMDYVDGSFMASSDFNKQVYSILEAYRPNWVILPSPLDYHRDHVIISASLKSICRRSPIVEKLLFYEVWAPVPATHVVDITRVAAQKRAAIRCHITPLSCADYENTIIGLNGYRGLYIGRDRLAEGFMVESVSHRKSLSDKLYRFCLDLLLGG